MSFVREKMCASLPLCHASNDFDLQLGSACCFGHNSEMLWRILTLGLITFWAVMTGLLLRTVYFPDHSTLAEVPPRLVLDLFLNQASAHTNTLHLYHHQNRLGHASVHVIRSTKQEQDALPLYRLIATGGFDPDPDQQNPRHTVGWRIEADLRDAEDIESISIDLSMPENNQTLALRWQDGQAMPEIELRQGRKLILNTEGAMKMADLAGALGPFQDLFRLKENAAGALTPLTVTAREGLMDLAGKNRRCYVIRLAAFEWYSIQALFTEVGELARVDLPQGLRLLEPLVHGLESDLVEN